jgi:hypothetical protein
MRRAPASFPRALHGPTARATTPSRRDARMTPRWLREPCGISAHPRALSRRATCPFAPPFAPFVTPIPRALSRRSSRHSARAPRAQLHLSSDPARYRPSRRAWTRAPRSLPGALRIRSRAPFCEPFRAPFRVPRCRPFRAPFSRPAVRGRDTAGAARGSRRDRLRGLSAFAPARALPSAGPCAVPRAMARASRASRRAWTRGGPRAQLYLSGVGAACLKREGSTGPASPVRRAGGLPRPAGEPRRALPVRRAGAPCAQQVSLDARGLQEPSRRAWTREGSTGPDSPVRRSREGSTRLTGPPGRGRAPRAQIHLSDAHAACSTRAGSMGLAGPPGRGRLHRAQ